MSGGVRIGLRPWSAPCPSASRSRSPAASSSASRGCGRAGGGAASTARRGRCGRSSISSSTRSSIIARAHDLILHSRVIDYRPGDWATLTYEQRKFFDWGGWLAVRPMDELPYWRVLMRRELDQPELGRVRQGARGRRSSRCARSWPSAARSATAISRWASRTRVDDYRGRKDTALALHYLWRIGDAMIFRRDRFERVYALTEAVAPPELIREVDAGRGRRLPPDEDGRVRWPDADAHGRPRACGASSPAPSWSPGGSASSRRRAGRGDRRGLAGAAGGPGGRRAPPRGASGRPRAHGVGSAGHDHHGRGHVPFAAGPGQRRPRRGSGRGRAGGASRASRADTGCRAR